MTRAVLVRWLVVLLALPGLASAQDVPLVPDSFVLAEPATRAIGAGWLTDAERSELRVFHGVWASEDLASVEARARVALNAWRFDEPALMDASVPAPIRAEAKLRSGELEQAVALTRGATDLNSLRIRAEALEGLGRYAEARGAIHPVVQALLANRLDEAADLTEGVRALAVRARIDGQPARDYGTMMTLLGRAHQELDRLYWPAKLAEAELLIEKSNIREAVAALHEVLSLNPREATAWYHLGVIALRRFDFDSANVAVAALKRINKVHPLADLLDAELRLVQNDPDEALVHIERILETLPQQRDGLAFFAAARAIQYEPEAMYAALEAYDAVSPGAAEAWHTAGRFLSMFRQYDLAAEILEEAVRRRPKWPAPQIELGLLEMQSGRDGKAIDVLRDLTELDPFNRRVANSLRLLEELVTFETIETDHFRIRYRAGEDEVLARMMPEILEGIYTRVTERFGWDVPEKTTIELMPDHQYFAVRITGMPHIHTIAACTGPVIAMEAPRRGAPTKHLGIFDWPRVLQHEFTHTVNLDQTNARIPHWLTEGAAVRMELAPRDPDDCRMLAESWRQGTLFDLDEIKWAFVRPREPGDRGKAYAQGAWMVQYMDEVFGPQALIDLLARYFEGRREADAIPDAFGVSREGFYEGFKVWAGEQVKAWGLAAEPSLDELEDTLRYADPEMAALMIASEQARLDAIARAMSERIGQPKGPRDRRLTAALWPPLMRPPVSVTDEQLAEWRLAHPDHPDLLRMELRRRIEGGEGDGPALIADLERLAELCPIDLYPHRRLASIHLAGATPERAIPHLERLDAHEQRSVAFAWELARLHRAAGRLDEALARANRVVHIDPYRPEARELAAAIAVEARDLAAARQHIWALTMLEPDRPQHQKRLERIDAILAGG